MSGAGEDTVSAAGDTGSEIPESLTYKVVLPEFEGPLDLLLYLCKSHEIDILHISVSFITQKYLEYLDLMKSMSVEVAAEYLVMAATLAYLKSRELVPQPEAVEVEADPEELAINSREELIARLLEYRKYKDAAEQLAGRPIEGRNVFGRGAPVELAGAPEGPPPLAEHSPWKLIEAFAKLLAEAEPKVTHTVLIDRMSVATRINQIIDRLDTPEGSFRFAELIDFEAPPEDLRHQLVVSLLALLELAKLKVVRVLQDPSTETFFITRGAQTTSEDLAAARRVEITSDGGGHKPARAQAGEEAGEEDGEEAGEEDGEEAVEDGDVSGDEPGDETVRGAAPQAAASAGELDGTLPEGPAQDNGQDTQES